tara:strand:+ start:10678 stop:11865 length:1188 start_codon:yes stop_codon:yes gene_type:complete
MLNNDTRKLIDYFIHDYKYNAELKNNNNNLFQQIYHQLNALDNVNFKSNLSVNSFKTFELLSSSFIPKHIKIEINKTKKIYTYKCNINNSNTTIYIKFYVSEYSKITITKQKQMLKKILLVIKFLFLYKSNNTINNLTIHIHMSKHKKFLPKNNTDILNQNNVNTAVTYACAKEGECIIYRKEEWFKVLIHELMHSLCLDFSSFNYTLLKKRIHNIFPVNSTFYISETYAELWAVILNSIFTSYYSTDNYSLFCKTINFIIYFEILFSTFQMVKILDYMNIYDYSNLYQNTSKAESFRRFYKENSNVFSYYILKFILLYNIDDTFNWIYKNNNIIQFNKNEKNFNELYELINILKSNPSMIQDINKMKTKYYTLKKKYRNDKFILSTMRMSLFEL